MKCILIDNCEKYDLKQFIHNEIIQKDIRLKKIYDNMDGFNYKYIVCIDNEKCVGVLPFIVYNNSIANVINSMPFIGYGGISISEINKDEIFKNIINFLYSYAKENDILLVTLCTEPFEEEKFELYKKYFKPDYIRENLYQYIDLSKDVISGIKSMFKRNAKKAIKYGVNILEDNSHEKLKYWYDNIYVKRLNETKCAIYPYSVFQNLVDDTDNTRAKMIYTIYEEKIIGGGLFLKQIKSLDNFMRVIDSDYFKTQAGTLIDMYSIEYAIKIGVKYYNWQSCGGKGTSIFEYKEGWGSEVNKHYYVTKVMGDISKLKETKLDVIKEAFKGIYVLPYEEFDN